MTPRIAVIGDFNPANKTHGFTNAALEHLGLAIEWIATDAVGAWATRGCCEKNCHSCCVESNWLVRIQACPAPLTTTNSTPVPSAQPVHT